MTGDNSERGAMHYPVAAAPVTIIHPDAYEELMRQRDLCMEMQHDLTYLMDSLIREKDEWGAVHRAGSANNALAQAVAALRGGQAR